MGAEYRALLLPRQRTFRPDAARLLELIQRLERERWLPAATGAQFLFDDLQEEEDGFPLFSASAVVDGKGADVPNPVTREWLGSILDVDSVLHWTIDDYDRTDLLYPFTKRPDAFPYCDLALHLPVDYVFDPIQTAFQEEEPASSWLSRLLRRRRPRRPKWGGTVLCSCGEDLAYQLGRWSDYRLRTVCPRCEAPFDPTHLQATIQDSTREMRLPGGLTYRFAFILDCDKSIPCRDQSYDFSVKPPLLSLVENVLDQEIVVVPHYY